MTGLTAHMNSAQVARQHRLGIGCYRVDEHHSTQKRPVLRGPSCDCGSTVRARWAILRDQVGLAVGVCTDTTPGTFAGGGGLGCGLVAATT